MTALAAKIDGLGADVVAGTSTFYQTNDPTARLQGQARDAHPRGHGRRPSTTRMKNVDKLHEPVVRGAGRRLHRRPDRRRQPQPRCSPSSPRSDLERGEIFGVPAALIVLLIVFGAVLAAFMPLVLSVISIVLALALTALIGQVYPMNTFVLNILTMMGLAVGIDYTLFVISRYREERARGLEKIDAIAATGATANRAIFFSGMTVVLAMIGMVIVPARHHDQHGHRRHARRRHDAAHRADPAAGAAEPARRPRQRPARAASSARCALKRANGHGGVWERLAHSIMRRPVIWLTVAVVALLAGGRPACS